MPIGQLSYLAQNAYLSPITATSKYSLLQPAQKQPSQIAHWSPTVSVIACCIQHSLLMCGWCMERFMDCTVPHSFFFFLADSGMKSTFQYDNGMY